MKQFMILFFLLFLPSLISQNGFAQIGKIKMQNKRINRLDIKKAKLIKTSWEIPDGEIVGSTDYLPAKATKYTKFPINIEPGQSIMFDVPMYEGGAFVSVKIESNIIKPVNKMKFRSVQSVELNQVISRLTTEQQTTLQQKILTFAILAGGKQYIPDEDHSGKFHAVFVIQDYKSRKWGKCTIKNISNSPIQGTLYALSSDESEKENLEMYFREQRLKQMIEQINNPDLIYLTYKLIERHLEGYPGGRSELENKFASTLREKNVRESNLVKFKKLIELNETAIRKRIQNPEILQISPSQPVQKKLLRKLFLMQVKPESQIDKIKPLNNVNQIGGKFEKKLRILSPNGGEVWKEGETHTIQWESQNIDGPVTIQLFWGVLGMPGGGVYTIKDIPNTGSHTFRIPHLSDDKPELSVAIMILAENGKIRDMSDGAVTIKMKGYSGKYLIRIIGIYSNRCADDAGWEWGCDAEEPYIMWAAFGPGYSASGVTNKGHDVEKGDFFLFSSDTKVLGAGPNRNFATYVKDPLFFVHMVAESDPGSPTRGEIGQAIADGLGVIFGIIEGADLVEIAKNLKNLTTDLIGIFVGLAAKGDDLYHPYVSVFDNDVLYNITSGTTKTDLDIALIEAVGNFDHYSIRRVDVYDNPLFKQKLQWIVLYAVIRESE